MSRQITEYQKVYLELKSRIQDGDYAIGTFLPTEADLMREYSVSRTTVRKALDLLSREGFIRATAGKGTQVIDFKTSQSLNAVTSVSETLRRQGHVVLSKSLYIDRISAGERLSQELQIAEGSTVVRIQRVQLSDGVPVAIMKNYIPDEMVPGIEKEMAPNKSLYIFIESNYGIQIDSTFDKITARSASFTDAEILEVPVGEPLIALARVCMMRGRPVCADHVSIVGKYYEFVLYSSSRNDLASYKNT